MLRRIADRLILQPTIEPIDPGDRERLSIAIRSEDSPATGTDPTRGPIHVTAWITRSVGLDPPDHPQWLANSERAIDGHPTQPVSGSRDNNAQLLLLKFPGAGGRAERGGTHPADGWSVPAEVWTVNHRGYGDSSGPATLHNFAETCEAVWRTARQKFPVTPIVVYGNSLGCLSALYLAARHPVAGVYLRNPPPLQQMISTRPKYNWWSFGLAKRIAAEVPSALDGVLNAGLSKSPALFVQSERDRVVPATFQDLIIAAYAGDKRVFSIAGADHHHGVPESQQDVYLEALKWLETEVLADQAPPQ